MKIAVMAGDGIGPEVTEAAVQVLEALPLPDLALVEADVGAAAYNAHGHPLPEATLDAARAADAILFGAVGDPACDGLERHLRPEQAVLGLRRELALFANLRPARIWPGLEHLSPLRPDIASTIDMLIVRELTGDVYFGVKGRGVSDTGEPEGHDRMAYARDEVRRIAEIAFTAAHENGARITSVDKANVLETSQLWRDSVIEMAGEGDNASVPLDHMYVDNAAMQLVSNPGHFDVVLTGNLFGDILSDLASACVGSIGLMPSASLGSRKTQFGTFGLYEPIHGSAPDIAGQGKANPMAAILSVAMMLRHSLGQGYLADKVEGAVAAALSDGVLGGDLGGSHGTQAITDAVLERLDP